MKFYTRILLSAISGMAMLVLTWVYLNTNFSLSAEDALYKKIAFTRFKLFGRQAPDAGNNFIFINTGKDLALIQDTATGTGNIAVTNRDELVTFLRKLNQYGVHPAFIVLDIEFYYPYNPAATSDTAIAANITDSLLQAALVKQKNITAPTLLGDANSTALPPLVRAPYPSTAAFTTYSDMVTKFQLYYGHKINLATTPLLLYNSLSGNHISNHALFNTSSGHICLNNIWPYYYLQDTVLNGAPNLADVMALDSSFFSVYNNKVIFIGNFDNDVVNTPAGKMPGTLVLANIYLTLLQGKHIVSYIWLLCMFATYWVLSYYAWFKKLPEIKWNFKFIFSKHVSSFLGGYVSYVGIMLLVSIASFIVFNVFVNVLFSALIFSCIDYFINKKYKPNDA